MISIKSTRYLEYPIICIEAPASIIYLALLNIVMKLLSGNGSLPPSLVLTIFIRNWNFIFVSPEIVIESPLLGFAWTVLAEKYCPSPIGAILFRSILLTGWALAHVCY